MNNNVYKNYLIDLVKLLIEDAFEAKKSANKEPNEFNNGKVIGYYEVLDTIQNQATAFYIDKNEIGLNKINPDKDLYNSK